MSPTQQAEMHFGRANANFVLHPPHQDLGLGDLADGLKQWAVAIRATYMKLEQLQALIKRQPGAR